MLKTSALLKKIYRKLGGLKSDLSMKMRECCTQRNVHSEEQHGDIF